MEVRFDDVEFGYGKRSVLHIPALEIRAGSVTAILGPNGSGKTTLLRTIVGEQPLDEGRVSSGANVRVGYYDQLLHFDDPQSLVVDAIRPPHKEFN